MLGQSSKATARGGWLLQSRLPKEQRSLGIIRLGRVVLLGLPVEGDLVPCGAKAGEEDVSGLTIQDSGEEDISLV